MPAVKCPTCRKTGDWFAAKYGPFCSHRCQLIDLGKWLDGQNVISIPCQPADLEDSDPLPAENPPSAD